MTTLQVAALVVFVVGMLCIIAALLDELRDLAEAALMNGTQTPNDARLARTDLERRLQGRR